MLSAVNALSDDDWRVYAVGDILEKNTKEVQYSKRMSEPTKKKFKFGKAQVVFRKLCPL